MVGGLTREQECRLCSSVTLGLKRTLSGCLVGRLVATRTRTSTLLHPHPIPRHSSTHSSLFTTLAPGLAPPGVSKHDYIMLGDKTVTSQNPLQSRLIDLKVPFIVT
ncbi:hypothetical protein BaRGS_00002367 [Batillaria attramentaria]|uniref:Uncharacterized protein n=1 Tax=Batillaria attramentaria TaxID=370345 RepID=A0ABD0M2Y0_9CAEN